MSDDFKELDDREHVLLRTGMYLGSVKLDEITGIIDYKYQTKSIVQGLVKCVEEAYQNSIDEHVRTNGEWAKNITINIDPVSGLVEVQDDGRGIPVEKIGNNYRPVSAWTKLRAGSNFNDESRFGAGQNGVGISLANIFSTKFVGQTCDGKKKLTCTCTDNMKNIEFDVVNGKRRGTSVSFTPDFSRFEVDGFTQDHLTVIRDRLMNLAIMYPTIRFSFNGEYLSCSSITNIARRFHESAIAYSTDKIGLVIAPSGSDEEFRLLSYVNGIYIKNGGTHIDHIIDSLVKELRPAIKKKFKIDVLPNQIKQHLLIANWCRDFPNTRFDGQTKERISNSKAEVSEYLQSIDFEKLSKQIMKSDAIVRPMVDAILFKKELEANKEKELIEKKAKKVYISNHIEAQSKIPSERTCFICEGDSAIGPIISVRNPHTTGGFALRGKVLNTFGMPPIQILKNKEMFGLTTILGLRFGDKNPDPLYHKIVLLTDADVDGLQIYCSLLQFFSHWPSLFKNGHLYRGLSPLYVAKKKVGSTVQRKIFYSKEEFEDAKLDKSWDVKYMKGLGSLDIEEYDEIINNPRLVKIAPLTQKDIDLMTIIFDKKNPDGRKKWLMNEEE